MKRYIVLSAMLMAVAFTQPAQSQARVNINISAQPLWGPVGYNKVEYYYMPDYGVYYHVPDARFVYFHAGQWVFAPVLPPTLGNIDYYSAYKVVINQPKAYLYFDKHKVKYAGYKGKGPKQVIIRDSRDPKYYVVKGHPNYGQAKKVSGASSQGKMKAAPKQGNEKMAPSAAPHSNHGGGAKKGGGHGGEKGGGHGKGGGKH